MAHEVFQALGKARDEVAVPVCVSIDAAPQPLRDRRNPVHGAPSQLAAGGRGGHGGSGNGCRSPFPRVLRVAPALHFPQDPQPFRRGAGASPRLFLPVSLLAEASIDFLYLLCGDALAQKAVFEIRFFLVSGGHAGRSLLYNMESIAFGGELLNGSLTHRGTSPSGS